MKKLKKYIFIVFSCLFLCLGVLLSPSIFGDEAKLRFNHNIYAQEKDFSTIKLAGDSTVNHEVKTEFIDEGIDYGNGGYVADDFSISIDNQVDINELGTYTYSYTLVAKNEIGLILTFTRTVIVEDTTPPTIELIGKSKIVVDALEDFDDPGVNCYDNYYTGIEHKETLNIISEKLAIKTYELTAGGLTTIVQRYIFIGRTNFSSITLQGVESVNHSVKEEYSDLGIDYGNEFDSSQFDVEIINNVNENVVGTYEYIYKLIYKETDEEYLLTREVNIIDDIAPTIQLNGDSEIEVYKSALNTYNDKNVSVVDNYYEEDNIEIITRLEQITDDEYKYYYKAKDASENESDEVFRIIRVKFLPITEEQISIIVGNSENEDLYSTEDIKILVNIDYNEDNNENEFVRLTILKNEESIYYVDEKQTDYKFDFAGIYGIKVTVGLVEKVIQIKINDISQKPIEIAKRVAIVILAIFVIVLICILINVYKAKKIKKKLDNY